MQTIRVVGAAIVESGLMLCEAIETTMPDSRSEELTRCQCCFASKAQFRRVYLTTLRHQRSRLSRAIEFCPVADMKPARWRSRVLPGDGHGFCTVGPSRSARLGQGHHSFAGQCLGEADAVAAGLADVGVVQEPVDGGGGQRFGHEFVEPGGV